jgi:hypothetical protein
VEDIWSGLYRIADCRNHCKSIISSNRIETSENIEEIVRQGEVSIVAPDPVELVKSVVGSGFLKSGCRTVPTDVYLIAVLTPFKDKANLIWGLCPPLSMPWFRY